MKRRGSTVYVGRAFLSNRPKYFVLKLPGVKTHYFLLPLLFTFNASLQAETRPTPKTAGSAPPVGSKAGTKAEEADVQKIREKYWARGNETEMGVVQNRLYPKRRRFELGLGGGTLSGDPFLSMVRYGGSLGFHFTEFLSLHLMYWEASVTPSSALEELEKSTKQTANTNYPKSYMGVEGRASILYGKLSLMGAAILYFDSFFSVGAGSIKTESGSNLLLSGGVGQQIHFSKVVSLNLDYKLLYYNEKIVGKVAGVTGNLGTDLGNRTNFSSAVTVSLSIFINPFGA